MNHKKRILITELRIFAMLMRLEEIKKERRVLVYGGLNNGKQFAQSIEKLTESCRKAVMSLEEFCEVSVIKDEPKINRASRRGNKESRRKNNFNHYS